MLKVKNVTVKYKDFVAIKNSNIEIKNGEIVGFIGSDGAGKSSLMQAIAGVKGFEGEIEFDGISYDSIKKAEKVKKRFGFMPQGLGLVLYDYLTIKEHFEFFRGIRGVKKDKEYEQKLLKMAGLEKFENRKAKNLSGGMRQKLSLVLSLLHRPDFLILDEPTTGVDPISRMELWEILKELKMTTLFSTAYMSEAFKMDKIYLFKDGEIIANGESQKLVDEIKEYCYEGEYELKNSISFSQKTYSLNKLNLPLSTPDLEGVFFVNALKENKILPKINITQKETNLPNIVLEGKNLSKVFGEFIANKNVDIELKKGEILGLLGANGAGKTTLIKMLLGLYPIDKGELSILGRNIVSNKDRLFLKEKIGYMSQLFSLYDDLTVRENMLYFGKIRKLNHLHDKVMEFSNMLGFSEYLDFLPKDLPLGINQRFSLSLAIMHEPAILFLDEPTSGVDVIARSQFWKLLTEIKEKWKISILVTTHYMNEAEYCDRVVVLKSGEKIVDSSVESLKTKFNNIDFEDIFFEIYKGNL